MGNALDVHSGEKRLQEVGDFVLLTRKSEGMRRESFGYGRSSLRSYDQTKPDQT